MNVIAIVLAAGKGTRMKSDLAKVLHSAAGRPLIAWVLFLGYVSIPLAVMLGFGKEALN